MFREAIYFIAFSIFLIVQYCIFVASTFVVDKLGATGNTYWCIVVVIFFIVNEFCFGGFSYEYDFDEGDDDEDWLNETEL